MKKLFLFLMACCLSLTMSAKVAYLLPNDCSYNSENGNLDGFIAETQDEGDQWPELNAAVWFRDNYVKNGKGEFITINETVAKYAEFSVIWIHLDRNGHGGIKDYYNDAFIAKLKTYCKNGGNLFLTKHATQLLGDGQLNRIYVKNGDADAYPISPEYPNSGWKVEKNDKQETVEVKWWTSTNFHGFDNSGHALYNNMEGGFRGDQKNVETLLVSAGKNHTDNNCGIPRDWILINEDDNYEKRLDKINAFNSLNNCRIIGTWGDQGWMQYAGNIEFYPHGENFKGTILMVGLAAYSWCANNFGYAKTNVERMTSNALSYLQGSAYWKDGEAPRDGYVGTSYVCTPLSNFEGYNIVLSSSNTDVASFDGGTLSLKAPGKTTIKATYTGNGMKSCKTQIVLEQEITVSYELSAPRAIEDLHLDYADRFPETQTNSFLRLHPMIEDLSVAYEITNGTGEALRVENMSCDGETCYPALVFTKAGTATVKLTMTESRTNQKWPADVYKYNRTITFAFEKEKPEHGWPDVLNSNVKPTTSVVLYDNTEGLDVTYTFDQEEGVSSWNNETHTITFNKPGTVKIIASVTEDTYTTKWAKKTYTYEKIVTVAYPQSAPRANEDLRLNESQCYPDNTDHWLRLHPVMEGLAATYEIQEAEGEVTKGGAINWEHVVNNETVHDLVWTKSGAVKLHITFVESRNDQNWPAGTYTFDRQVSFTFVKEKPEHGWSPTNLDDIKLNQEVVLYDITQDLPVTYTFEPAENVTWDAENHKVKFVKAGDVNITASVTETRYLTSWPTGTHTYDKTITVAAPVVSWAKDGEGHDMVPEEAAVMEESFKRTPSAVCDVPGLTVKYRSADSTKISIDETTGKLMYKAPTEGDGIAITAYVTVGELEYSISHLTKCFAPLADWVTEPTSSGMVGVDMPIAAKVRYGAATLGFDCVNCSVVNGKLHFTNAGEATVQPYAEAYGVKYYNYENMGNKITINVASSDTVYTRTVTPGYYGTICLERTSTKLEGATFYWPAYKNKAAGEVDYIVLEAVDTLRAGQGYFFLASDSEIKVTMSLAETALSAPLQHNPEETGVNTRGMHGNFGPDPLTVPNYVEAEGPNEYVLNSNSELVYGTGNWIGEHRAYLKMSEVPVPTAQVPGRRYVTMVVNHPNTTTGWENVNDNDNANKMLINGQIYIMRSGRLYTIDGKLAK